MTVYRRFAVAVPGVPAVVAHVRNFVAVKTVVTATVVALLLLHHLLLLLLLLLVAGGTVIILTVMVVAVVVLVILHKFSTLVCSTSLPGGNQVDGLPPESSFLHPT